MRSVVDVVEGGCQWEDEAMAILQEVMDPAYESQSEMEGLLTIVLLGLMQDVLGHDIVVIQE